MQPVDSSAGLIPPADQNNMVHQLPVDNNQSDYMSLGKTLSILILVILLGAASGFGVNYVNSARGAGGGDNISPISEGKDVKETAGIADKKTFKDSAEGELEDGGHESGEGSFKLIRPGGEDQTAYLTSSTVDLSKYVGKKVRVYGETFSSQNVGWLMDVGFVEILE